MDAIAPFQMHLSFNINALRDIIMRFNFQFALLRINTTEKFWGC
jgi:hypothetical protein